MSKVVTTLFGTVALLSLPVRAPMVESLAWLTDVHDSHNGTEDRLQLRAAPRRQVQYEIPQQAWERAHGFNTLRGALRQKWAVPMWSETQAVGAIANGATSVTCNTTIYDLRDESLVLLYQSNSVWQVVEVTGVSSGSIAISATSQTFSNAMLIPLRIGYIRGDAELDGNGHNAVARILFDLDDNIEITSSAPAQYLGNDIYFDEVLMGGERYEVQLTSQQDFADYDLGKVDRRAPWTYARHVMQYQHLLTTPAEMFAFRQWLHRRAGKYRAFWAPTYEQDLRLTSTGTITTTIQFQRDSYDEWSSDRTHIAFEDNAGTWYARAVSNIVIVNPTTLQATLSSALNLPASRIKRISYLGLKRLSSDAVDLNWIGNGVCQASLSVTELSP